MAETVILKHEQTWRDDMPGASWKKLYSNGTSSAVVRCPKCMNFSVLTDHTIDENGRVEPSLVCPWPACQPDPWHVFVVLEGWTP